MFFSYLFYYNYFIKGKAFCSLHCEKVEELGYPTNLREFLLSCGTKKDVNPDSYNKDMKKIVDAEIKKISQQIDAKSLNVKSSSDVQGTSYLLHKKAFRQAENFEMDGEGDDCNKW